MATIVKSKSGNKIVLRNPAEKAKRYARQMKTGRVRETGKKLTISDLSFRAGYLTARADEAKAFNAKRKK